MTGFKKFVASTLLHMGRTSSWILSLKLGSSGFFPTFRTNSVLFIVVGKHKKHQSCLLLSCTATGTAIADHKYRLHIIPGLIHGTSGVLLYKNIHISSMGWWSFTHFDGSFSCQTGQHTYPSFVTNKQQPVKNDLNCSEEPLDSFLVFGLLK